MEYVLKCLEMKLVLTLTQVRVDLTDFVNWGKARCELHFRVECRGFTSPN
jgi:hypothetical protein